MKKSTSRAAKTNLKAAAPAAKGSKTSAPRPPNAPVAQPYPIVDRGTSSTYGYNNTLIEAATQNQDRMAVNLVDYDIHRTITAIGRRTLLSLGRTMFWRIPQLQAAILEQAHLAVTPFTPRYLGSNKVWGKAAFDWLTDWHKVMDLAGWPYDYESYCETLLINHIVDGDPFTLLTENKDGAPRVQMIGSHRVGSRFLTGQSAKVRLQGDQLFIDDILVDSNLPQNYSPAVEWSAPVIDGCVVDSNGAALAYRVYTDPAVSQKYQDYSARNIFPAFLPIVPGQLRGFSMLASSVFDWQDIREYKRFELLAQKAFASKTITSTTEDGDGGSGGQPMPAPAQFDSNGKMISIAREEINGGTITYLKANAGEKLEAFDYTRPSKDSQSFQETSMRDAMRGTEWDIFFSLDPGNVGGAPMRVIVDKINRVLRKRRRLVGKNILRVDIYALSKAIERGELPFDAEWFKWTHQGPSDVTADRRYDAQTDEMEYELGWATMEDVEKRRNGDWLAKREQREIEVTDKLTRAKRIADKFEISIQEAMQEIGATGTSSLQRREMEEEPPEKQEAKNETAPAQPAKPKGE